MGWFDGSYQIVKAPPVDTILTVTRSGVDDAGDMNGDGSLTSADEDMLLLAISDPQALQAAHPDAPGLIVGDIDGNGFIEAADHLLWTQLPPH